MKAFFSRQFDYDRDGRWGRVVDCAVVGFNTAFLAFETGDNGGKSEVGAIIRLLTRPKGEQNFAPRK